MTFPWQSIGVEGVHYYVHGDEEDMIYHENELEPTQPGRASWYGSLTYYTVLLAI